MDDNIVLIPAEAVRSVTNAWNQKQKHGETKGAEEGKLTQGLLLSVKGCERLMETLDILHKPRN